MQDVTSRYKRLQVITSCKKMLNDITRCYKRLQVVKSCKRMLQVVTSCFKLLQDVTRSSQNGCLLQVVASCYKIHPVTGCFSQTIKGCHRYWKDQHLVEKQTIATGFQGKGAIGALVELVAGVRVWIHLDKPWSQSFNLKVSLPEAPQALGTQLQWQVLQWVQAGRQEEVEAELATVQELPVGQLQLEQQLQDELGRSLYLDLCGGGCQSWRWRQRKRFHCHLQFHSALYVDEPDISKETWRQCKTFACDQGDHDNLWEKVTIPNVQGLT